MLTEQYWSAVPGFIGTKKACLLAVAFILFRGKLAPVGHFIVKILPSLIVVVVPFPATVNICTAYEPAIREIPLESHNSVVVGSDGYAKPFDVMI